MTRSLSTSTAVFSLFNPGPSIVDNVRAVQRQVETVIVVDDGSTADTSATLDILRALGCHVIGMERNTGIAAALNAGISRALSQPGSPPDFILTMDQDSMLAEGYVSALVAAFESATAAGIKVGMVAPGSVEGLPRRTKGTVRGVLLGDEPIQSGLMVPAGVFRELGLLMSELFIDGVDSEFYLRARRAGYAVVLAPDAGLGHSLGAMTAATLFGRELRIGRQPVRVRTAATMRYYYIHRNRLALAARYWKSAPFWVLRGFAMDLRHLVLVSTLAPGRTARLRAAMAGVADGLRGRLGPRTR